MIKFFKKAFKDMKDSAKAQHEVDKANFEENRGHNTFAKAKADAKECWDNAHLSIEEKKVKAQEEREEQIALANERKEKAEKKLEELSK